MAKRVWMVGLFAVLGMAIGVLTVYGQDRLPGQWTSVANSGAVWLLFAFIVGSLISTDGWAAAGGVGVLVGAVIGYYAAVPVVVEGAAANLHSVTIWTGTALVGGPVFGVAGRWWRAEEPPRSSIALGVLGGVFVAEGLYDVATLANVRTAGWVMLSVGLLLPIALGRSARQRLLGLAAMLPVVVVTFGVYQVINWSFERR